MISFNQWLKDLKYFKRNWKSRIFQCNSACFSVGLNLGKHCIFPKKAFLWANPATVDLSPTHTQNFLPHPKLKLLPVAGQPFPLPPPIQKQPTQRQRAAPRPSLYRAVLEPLKGITITFPLLRGLRLLS